MNRLYQTLHEMCESYDVTEDDPDELAGVVARETLDKLFVQEVLHPGGDLDVDVLRAEAVEDSLIVPEVFTIISYTITERAHEYRIDLSAAHDEHEYTYRFRGLVQRSGEAGVKVLRAAVQPKAVTRDHRCP